MEKRGWRIGFEPMVRIRLESNVSWRHGSTRTSGLYLPIHFHDTLRLGKSWLCPPLALKRLSIGSAQRNYSPFLLLRLVHQILGRQ